MVRIEEHTTCGCCGAPVIRVPKDVTFSGTIHECGRYLKVDNSSYGEEQPKGNKTQSYPSKPQKYIWRERNKK